VQKYKINEHIALINVDREEIKYSGGKNMSQCHFAHHYYLLLLGGLTWKQTRVYNVGIQSLSTDTEENSA
jgi:hypothetical protein